MSAEPLAISQAEMQRLWSVTTLRDMALGNGPGLVNWIVGQVATAAVEKHGLLGRMIQEEGKPEAVKWLADHRWRKSTEAKVRGTDLHAAAEAIAKGQTPHVEEHIAPYVAQLERWLEQWQPEFLMAEAPVYNLTHGYAGTADGVMRLQGHRLLYDYKTTEHPPGGDRKRPPWPEVALQLVAYARAEEVGVLAEQRYDGGKRYYVYDPTQHHEPMPEIDQERALCIVVSPHDCVAVPVRIDDQVWDAWLHVIDVARWQQESKTGLFGAPLAVTE